MQWLQRLKSWWSGKPVKTTSGKPIKPPMNNLQKAAAHMKLTYLSVVEKILNTPTAQAWIRSLSESQYKLLKKQIAKQEITTIQLSKKIEDYFYKQLYTDNTIKSWLNTLSPNEVSVIKSKVKNGTYTLQDIQKMAKSGLTPTWKTISGIRFSQQEINNINGLSNTIWKDIIGKLVISKPYTLKNFKTANGTIQNIRIQPISIQQAKQVIGKYESVRIPEAWVSSMGTGGYEIIIVPELTKTLGKQRFISTITHEISHIKDPSFVSPKLSKTYDPYNPHLIPWTEFNLSKSTADSGKNWFKNYYLHTFEINAIIPQVTHQLVSSTKRMLKTNGIDETIKALNELESYFIGSTTNWTQNSSKLLGYTGKFFKDDIPAFLDAMHAKNPAGYLKLKAHIAKQARYLKTEINKISIKHKQQIK